MLPYDPNSKDSKKYKISEPQKNNKKNASSAFDFSFSGIVTGIIDGILESTKMIAFMIAFIFFVGAIVGSLFLIYTTVTNFMMPTVISAFANEISLSFSELIAAIIIAVVEGAITGTIILNIRKYFSIESENFKNYLSKIISFKILKQDPTYFANLILSIIVGSFVSVFGLFSGLGSLTELISGHDFMISEVYLFPSTFQSLIIELAGGGGNGFGLSYWNIILILLIILIIFAFQGVVLGGGVGLVISFLFGVITSGVRKGTMYLFMNLNWYKDDSSWGQVKESLRVGTLQGALIGGIVELVKTLITLIISWQIFS